MTLTIFSLFITGTKRKRWSDEEESDFMKAFGQQIKNKQNVSSEDIRSAKRKFTSFMERSEAVIRSKVNNMVLGKIKCRLDGK